ncbi:MAG: sulfite exporter TauE/SafE family protein [Gammaproteobacteria bacterium]
MTFEPLQWIFALLGAFMVGVSKSGITGLSILSVALFTNVFPSSKQASGIVLPLLIFGDIVAVLSYRQHTQWRYLWKLFPFTAIGVVLGYFALGWVSDRHARVMIGVIIVVLAGLSYWHRYRSTRSDSDTEAGSHSWAFAAAVGIVAGFITLVANAAGPLMAIYLVSMRLPKMQYVGTAAVFFMCLNLFKVPFMVNLGLITAHSFRFNLMLAPAVVIGALVGRWLVIRINQALFEKMVLSLSAIAGVLLLL